MAFLTIPDQNTVIRDAAEIKQFLNKRGVIYEQWEASVPFEDDADQDTILNAYAHGCDQCDAQYAQPGGFAQ